MKNFNLLLAILGLFTMTFYSSCNDACSDVLVPENCVCNEGVITCDPCASVTCPAGYTCDNGNCIVDGFIAEQKAGFISADETWTSDKIYILNGKVVVADGATLTIEAGTIVKGAEGTGSLASALIVARGGKLIADGTATAPIIFTSILDDIVPGQNAGSNLNEENSGLWGGLIILGRAPISVEDNSGEAQIEGIPADDTFGAYGGGLNPDPNDNSGIIRYVSVRHGGALIGDGNEINGITLGGVGAGTVIENIEVVGNLDDGIEWFGGTVNVTNALVWAADDDALDIDQAYSGTVENAVVICFAGTDHALEIDGPEGNATGAFTLNNITVKGKDDELGQYRDGATGTTSNVYFFGFEKITDGEGDLSLSTDDNGNYTTFLADLTFANLEVVLTPDATVITDMLKDGIDAFGTVVTQGNNTVGADISVFGWTYASAKGALNF